MEKARYRFAKNRVNPARLINYLEILTILSKIIMLSAAAATLLISGAVMAQETAPASETKVHCGGVNACKGTSDCKTADNACKGHGMKEMTAEECAKAGGKVLEM